MILQTVAFKILNGSIGATYEDRVEAFKFINDNWLVEKLSPQQEQEYKMLVEGGVIETSEFRYFGR